MSAHTPGPWQTHDDRDESGELRILGGFDVGADDKPRAELVCLIADTEHEEDNARLIAAAPELATVLRAIYRAEWTTVTLQGMTPQHRALLERARAALTAAGIE
jgi:hypothetical protein